MKPTDSGAREPTDAPRSGRAGGAARSMRPSRGAVQPGGAGAALLACPRCGGALARLSCGACELQFPAVAGVPWLFADPEATRLEWRNRFDHARRRLEADRAGALEALCTPLGGAARRRLDTLVSGQAAAQQELGALLGPVLGKGDAPLESHVALGSRLPATQGLMTYQTNVFRDWCWGEAENAAALAEVLGALEAFVPSRVLVLGAGAGRLAYDLHGATAAAQTVALDFNPLLACVGARVSRGETLTLTEFPLAPRRPQDVAIARRLAAPAPSRAGLFFVLADALQAPFRTGAFDLVVTPWLLDILEVPPRALLGQVSRLLRPGGLWINHGSVAFGAPDPAGQLTGAELIELAGTCGFDVSGRSETILPYLCCPDSRHARREEVLTFRALRRRACKDAHVPASRPDWLVGGRAPIPASPAFRAQAVATRTHAYIMSLIDGQRSIEDVARVLAQHRLMDEAGARVALAGFFATMHDDANRARGL